MGGLLDGHEIITTSESVNHTASKNIILHMQVVLQSLYNW